MSKQKTITVDGTDVVITIELADNGRSVRLSAEDPLVPGSVRVYSVTIGAEDGTAVGIQTLQDLQDKVDEMCQKFATVLVNQKRLATLLSQVS